MWMQRLVLVLLGLAFVWSSTMLWAPALIRSQLVHALSSALGRGVQVGAVQFRPWSLELSVHDVVVQTQDGADAQLRVGLLYVNAAIDSVWRLAPVLDALQIDSPQLTLRQTAPGQLDIDDILARLRAPSDAPAGPTPAFALFNVVLSGGSVDFRDEVVGQQHTLRGLQLGVPFLSNLPADRAIETSPHLAFTLNGSVFDSSALSTPFLDSRKTAARLHISDLDVAPYLAYWPKDLPVSLRSGELSADLSLEFEQTPSASVVLRGNLQARKLQLNDAAGTPLLAVDRVAVDLTELRPLEQRVRLAALDVDAPRLQLRRDARGRLNVAPSSTESVPPAASTVPASATPASPWTVTLAAATLRDGQVAWRDQAASADGASAEMDLEDLQLRLQDLAYPFQQPAVVQASASLHGPAGAAGTLTVEGTASDKAADLRAKLDSLSLALAAPYLRDILKPRLQGELSAQLGLAWKGSDDVVVAADQLTLTRPRLAGVERTEIGQLELREARVALASRAVDLGTVRMHKPQLAVARDAKGGWMFEDWLVAGRPAAAEGGAADRPWQLRVRALEVDGGAVDYSDQSLARPVALALSNVRVRAGALQLGQRGQVVPVELAAVVAAGKTTPGRLSLRGQAVLDPLAVQAQVEVERFPAHALEPYFGDALHVRLARADASFKGDLRYAVQKAGPVVHLAGDVGVDDLRAQQGDTAAGGRTASARDLLTWANLRLRGVVLDMAPGAALTLVVQDTALSDFYARVIVDENGRINLQDLTKSDAPAASPPAAASPAATQASAPTAGPSPNIRFGPIQLHGGRVLFSDRFVKPNYTANLTELQGSLSAFDARGSDGGPAAMADLNLRGRVEGTAALEISGKLNPLAKPLALDIRAKVRDLELPPLSTYAVKYAGHGIERGKLSVDLHYEVLPNGQLTASNSLVLNQLTFGQPVPGAPASLPVRLATALLADRNGVIDLNLPIQGSLNDPQFSLGPVILKAIGNLILKAVTAPFSLLANAFGGSGGEEMSRVAFEPGAGSLDEKAEQHLDKVAQALIDRPALKLTVIGSASQEAELDGYKRARLTRMVQAEKRRELLALHGELPARAPGAPATVVDPAEYPALLKAVYGRSELKNKPRNAVGMVKEQSVPEMEQLLMAEMQVSEESVRNLAVQRSVVVRDYLAARQVPLDRLFLGAPKMEAFAEGWTPRADLELTGP
jgi:uncharacterized protein involved in outer membrane biogenesis